MGCGCRSAKSLNRPYFKNRVYAAKTEAKTNAKTEVVKAEVKTDVKAEVKTDVKTYIPGPSKWLHLDISQVEEFIVEGTTEEFLEVGPKKSVKTKEVFAEAVEIFVVARTERNNIRIKAFDRMEVIFNWELENKQLRIHKPDGVGVTITPLTPEVWYNLHWFISANEMKIFIDNQLVFQQAGTYNLSPSPVSVYAHDSVIDIKSFEVKKQK